MELFEVDGARTEKKFKQNNDIDLGALFDTLADWNHQLEHAGIDFEALERGQQPCTPEELQP